MNKQNFDLSNIKNINLIGSKDTLEISQNEKGLEITLPNKPSNDKYAYVIRFETKK